MLQSLLGSVLKNCPGLEFLENEPLSKHTSFAIGGPVALMLLPKSIEELAAVCGVLWSEGASPLFIGCGTNLLADDEGFDGVLVKTGQVSKIRLTDKHTIEADCGALLSKIALKARQCSLSGMEFAHGIPGSLGGGVIMNAGAYDGELKDIVTETVYLNRDGSARVYSGGEQGFSYRDSVFAGLDGLVLKSRLRLREGDQSEISAKMKELAGKRIATQPLELPSAGSTFKRPKGAYAAALIEKAGLKGLSVGGAMVSPKHSGFIVNTGGASCKDVLELIELVRERVYKASGIRLETEIKRLG